MKNLGIVLLVIVGLFVLLVMGGLVLAKVNTPGDDEVPVGLTDGEFQPCPDTPNCVSTMADDEIHGAEPLNTGLAIAAAQDAARAAILKIPRTRILEEQPGYIRAVTESAVFHFVDDVEIYIPSDGAGLVHYRSASRAGRGDMGANRKRYEAFRNLLLNQES